MAYKLASRLTSSINNILPLVPCRLFHASFLNNATHSYTTKLYPVPSEKLQHFINKNPLVDIRKKSGAVVRFREIQTIVITEESSSDLLIVGKPYQIEKAFDYITDFIDGEEKTQVIEKGSDDNKLIWHGYKRNYKGQYPPKKARKKCIRNGGKRICGNPCPLCQMVLQSDYEVHYTDIEILNQFICPFTWNILEPSTTGICRIQHQKVVAAINKARLHGYIRFTLPLHTDKPLTHKPAGVPTDRQIKVKMH